MFVSEKHLSSMILFQLHYMIAMTLVIERREVLIARQALKFTLRTFLKHLYILSLADSIPNFFPNPTITIPYMPSEMPTYLC